MAPVCSRANVELTNKQLTAKYFILNESQSGGKIQKYVCKLCYPEWTEAREDSSTIKTISKGVGFQWAVQHLRGKHDGQYETTTLSKQTTLISKDAQSTFDWIQWITSENRELDFVEKKLVRKHTTGNIKPISVPTLKDRMFKTVQVMEQDIGKRLPPKFGVTIDGWSDYGMHYLGVFAVGPKVPDGKILLGFSPFENEADLSADQHAEYLNTLLPYFNRTMEDVLYLVGDNCAVNQKLAKDLNVPMIGCNSHKLNLAVTLYIGLNFKDDDTAKAKCTVEQLARREILQLLSTLMSKLKSIKGKARLREYTDYVALKANETRWNGNYRMTTRYIQFKDVLELLAQEESEVGRCVAALLPSPIQVLNIIRLQKDLAKFNAVSLLLQKRDGSINLSDVRALFDKLIRDFGADFKQYLAKDAEIVCSPQFEDAIVKAIEGLEPLTDAEQGLLLGFKLASVVDLSQDVEEVDGNIVGNYGVEALVRSRKRLRLSTEYLDFKLVPITSNIVERFFSQVKLNMTPLRNSLLPSTLETIMFLKLNSPLMNVMTVQKAMNL